MQESDNQTSVLPHGRTVGILKPPKVRRYRFLRPRSVRMFRNPEEESAPPEYVTKTVCLRNGTRVAYQQPKAFRKPERLRAVEAYPRCVDCRRAVDTFTEKVAAHTKFCEPDWCRWCARPLSENAKELCDRTAMQRQADLLAECGGADWVR